MSLKEHPSFVRNQTCLFMFSYDSNSRRHHHKANNSATNTGMKMLLSPSEEIENMPTYVAHFSLHEALIF